MLTAACGSADETSRYWNLGEGGWRYADTLAYDVDTACVADIAVVVRHAANYEYSNLWLEFSYPTMADSLRTDTFNLVLADDFGRWRGHGIGVGMQYADTLLRGVHLQDSTTLRLRHIMRADTLPGIEQVGIVVLRANL